MKTRRECSSTTTRTFGQKPASRAELHFGWKPLFSGSARFFDKKGTLKCSLRFVRNTIDRGKDVFSVKSAFGHFHTLWTIASCVWSPSLSPVAGCGQDRWLRDRAMVRWKPLLRARQYIAHHAIYTLSRGWRKAPFNPDVGHGRLAKSFQRLRHANQQW